MSTTKRSSYNGATHWTTFSPSQYLEIPTQRTKYHIQRHSNNLRLLWIHLIQNGPRFRTHKTVIPRTVVDCVSKEHAISSVSDKNNNHVTLSSVFADILCSPLWTAPTTIVKYVVWEFGGGGVGRPQMQHQYSELKRHANNTSWNFV